MAQIDVDPNTLNDIYRQKLAAANDENVLLNAAVTQLQTALQSAQDQHQADQATIGRLQTELGAEPTDE